MSEVTIYHNPRCSKSRRVLELIQQAGVQPVVIEYLKNPPSAAELQQLTQALGQPLAQFLRTDDELYKKLAAHQGAPRGAPSEVELIEQVVRHPELLNRPIVVTPLGARLCRPEELLYEILPQARAATAK